MYLLDTVVLSELRKGPPRHNPHVVSWLASVSPDDLFISAISIGEIERGIERHRSVDPAFAVARPNGWMRCSGTTASGSCRLASTSPGAGEGCRRVSATAASISPLPRRHWNTAS